MPIGRGKSSVFDVGENFDGKKNCFSGDLPGYDLTNMNFNSRYDLHISLKVSFFRPEKAPAM
ncbi:MAG: hypothetical protein DYG98_23955 [Haliscomenobacteraceae bacterium CHB4]|nr:hypothetical protein [Haliscomenobacteraceae bacterium CHB4]